MGKGKDERRAWPLDDRTLGDRRCLALTSSQTAVRNHQESQLSAVKV